MKDYARNLSIAAALVAVTSAPALAHEVHYHGDRVKPRPAYHYPVKADRWYAGEHKRYARLKRKSLRRLYEAHARWHRHNDHRRGHWYHREHRRLHRSMGIDHWYFVHLGWRNPVRYYAYRW